MSPASLEDRDELAIFCVDHRRRAHALPTAWPISNFAS